MNCLERKQHTDSWWSCKMTSIPLRTSHLPAAVNEWTHPESIEMEIGLIPHYLSNLGDSFEDTTHHTFASHHLPPPPARSALPCPGFSLRHPTVYRCSSSRIWGPSALTRLVRRNFKRTLSERLNSFELLLDARIFQFNNLGSTSMYFISNNQRYFFSGWHFGNPVRPTEYRLFNHAAMLLL